MSNTKIPGLSFSWKRALGVIKVKREFTKATGIPTTKAGVERKVGGAILKALFGKNDDVSSKETFFFFYLVFLK